MKFLIKELEEGVHQILLSGYLDPGKFPVGKYFSEEIEVKLDISRFNQNVSAEISASAAGSFHCDRCLDIYHRQISEKAGVFFQFEQRGSKSDFEYEEDVILLHEDEKEYDISEFVAEMFGLAIPIKKLCSEKCKGLCPTCGANLNREKCNCNLQKIDPRLEGLKKYYK